MPKDGAKSPSKSPGKGKRRSRSWDAGGGLAEAMNPARAGGASWGAGGGQMKKMLMEGLGGLSSAFGESSACRTHD